MCCFLFGSLKKKREEETSFAAAVSQQLYGEGLAGERIDVEGEAHTKRNRKKRIKKEK